jgi:hypothetical protein
VLAYASSAEFAHDAEHVRPLRGLAVLDARQRIHEPDHLVVGERAYQDPAAVHADRQNRRRHDIVVARTPDAAFELDDVGTIGKGDEIAIRYRLHFDRLIYSMPEPKKETQ